MIPSYPYLQDNGVGRRRALWLPLFLAGMPRFRAAVPRYALPTKPLRRYWEEHPASPGTTAPATGHAVTHRSTIRARSPIVGTGGVNCGAAGEQRRGTRRG